MRTKRPRLAANEMETTCVREDAEGNQCDAALTLTVEYDPEARARSWEATGCPHVDTYTEEEREMVEDALDDHAREQGERDDDR